MFFQDAVVVGYGDVSRVCNCFYLRSVCGSDKASVCNPQHPVHHLEHHHQVLSSSPGFRAHRRRVIGLVSVFAGWPVQVVVAVAVPFMFVTVTTWTFTVTLPDVAFTPGEHSRPLRIV